MQQGMLVQEYNAVLLQRRKDLQNLPHIDVPDATTQATVYSTGLLEHLKSRLENRIDTSKKHDVSYLMQLLLELESAQVQARVLTGKSAPHVANAGTNQKWNVRKKKAASAPSSPSGQQSAKSGKQKQQSSKRRHSAQNGTSH